MKQKLDELNAELAMIQQELRTLSEHSRDREHYIADKRRVEREIAEIKQLKGE